MKLRIGLDCDDTCNYWYKCYLDRFGEPKDDKIITRNVQRILSKDKDFWLNLPEKHKPNFDVTLYCTKRVNPKTWTKQWLLNHDYPTAPVYQVFCQGSNKAYYIKGRVDVFIDDSISNFIAMNKAGVPCLLMDSELNQEWGPIGKVYSLDKGEIEEAYYLFKEFILPNFNNLL
jgi:hypothetical protein